MSLRPASFESLRSVCTSFSVVIAGLASHAGAALDFNRDIRPILSEHCYRCHGFDEGARKAQLRLDTRDGAMTPAKSGARAVVPGNASASELVKRIATTDKDDVMPPIEHGKPLSQPQIDSLRRWISEGAVYARHWSFEIPKRTPPATSCRPNNNRSSIDAFVLDRLRLEGLQASPEADKYTLLRRVALDLTGIPPAPQEVSAFLSDASPGAYERAVDRLLSSPRYGERMAVDWLDAARYADTNGYFGDKTRSAWPWRQWVIEAFNRNLPFDEFTIEQLAGDLLPNPSRDQLVATGFQRNSMANNESGIIDEEYRVEAIIDRIDAMANTWLGLTIGCAQCHDHKFDPISQKDFYQLFAFFNSGPEKGLVKDESPPPVLEVPSLQQTENLARMKGDVVAAERAFAPLQQILSVDQGRWEATAGAELAHPVHTPSAVHCRFEQPAADESFREAGSGTLIYGKGILGSGVTFDGTKHLECPIDLPLDSDRPWTIALWLKATGSLSGVFAKVDSGMERRGVEMIWQKGRLLVNLVHRWGVDAIEAGTRDPLPGKSWRHLVVTYDGSRKAAGLCLFCDGESVALQINRDTLSGSVGNSLPLLLGRRDSGLGCYGEMDEFWVLDRTVSAAEARRWFWSERLRGIIDTPATKRPAADAALLTDYYVARHGSPAVRTAYEHLTQARDHLSTFRATIPTAMVMSDLPKPRETHILMRGVYDQPGESVVPDVPSALGSLPDGWPRNRLGLARWLVSRDNPVTARVVVNRLWQQCFGEGLVRTVNDFGSQGEPPTHPELLDWLALDFMDHGWDVKALLRTIVTSATYRQSSAASPEAMRRDPENRLLARGPRFRMSAEMLRDQALAVSGLLVNEIGGPSVKPFQPPGIWEAVSYNGDESYAADRGAGLWRRTLYTFWKRQAPPPATLAFDGPTREKCTIRRARTNTPLQALVLLNDETYMAAAFALASHVLGSHTDDAVRTNKLFGAVLSRPPDGEETAIIRSLLERQRQRFNADPGAAEAIVGESRADASDLAAWTVVAHTILNLDEAITRR